MGDFPLSALLYPHLTNAILSADILIFDGTFNVCGASQHGGVAVDSHLLVRYIDSGIFDVTALPHLYGIGLCQDVSHAANCDVIVGSIGFQERNIAL